MEKRTQNRGGNTEQRGKHRAERGHRVERGDRERTQSRGRTESRVGENREETQN